MTEDDQEVATVKRAAHVAVTAPGPLGPDQVKLDHAGRHRGVLMTGHDGADGPKAFYIHIEAKPDRVEQVRAMLRDIMGSSSLSMVDLAGVAVG